MWQSRKNNLFAKTLGCRHFHFVPARNDRKIQHLTQNDNRELEVGIIKPPALLPQLLIKEVKGER